MPNSYPGVYKLDCTCGKSYVGETKKKILTRTLQHQKDSFEGNWQKSGVSEHSKTCHGRFNWMEPIMLQREDRFYPRKVAEALEIQCCKTGPNEVDGTNRDKGLRLSSQSWRSFFHDWRVAKPRLKRWNNHWEGDATEDDDDVNENSNLIETNQVQRSIDVESSTVVSSTSNH